MNLTVYGLPLSIIVLNVAWPVFLGYCLYRIILAVGGRRRDPLRRADTILGGVGGVVALWARTLYSLSQGGAIEWAFALTLVGIALMVLPRLVMLAIPRKYDRW